MSGKFAPEFEDAPGLASLPVVDCLPRARHSRQHRVNRQYDFELRPYDVHSPAPDPVFRNGFHKNRQLLTHAYSPDGDDSAGDICVTETCPQDEPLTLVKVVTWKFPA